MDPAHSIATRALENAAHGACEKLPSNKPGTAESGLPRRWTLEILTRMQARYGHRWTAHVSGIESAVLDEWSRGLAGLTGEQIARGLADWQSEWPPSLPEFRDACLGKRRALNEHGLDYVPQHLRKSTAAERDPRKLLSSTERDERRQHAREHIAGLRASLSARR